MQPVDMDGANVTLTLGAPYITVHEGCGIRFDITDSTEVELVLGDLPYKAVQLNFEVEALREVVRQGGAVLSQMDALRSDRTSE
jgi:hypothetical protein